MKDERKVAIVTGASSGIGEATAEKLVVASPLFWLHIAIGIVIPLVLVLGKSVSQIQFLIAGALAIFGVLLEKT